MKNVHLVIDLDSIQGDDLAWVGNKAFSLAKLSHLGFNVPAGFCVTGIAYREHLKTNGIMPQLNAASAGLKDAATAEKNQILSNIRKFIIQAPLSETLSEQIGIHYLKLAADHIAVRSSATAEDLPGYSFAGQYDTYLGIADLEGCLDAVKKCWASLWSLRAYEYRQKNGFDHFKMNMAVIVQSFIAADASSVVFTADPVTGRIDRMIVESCFGLGDALVSGKITPDRFVIDKDIKIVTKAISEKKFESVLDEHGAIRHKSIKGKRALAPSIDETVVQKIAKRAKAVEAEFGCPQDIEWAIHGTDIYLLQSRPITTLGRTQSPRDRWVWSNFLAQEVLPDVVTPITRSIIDILGEAMFDPALDIICIDRAGTPIYDYFAGRLYFHASFWIAVIRTLPASKKYDFTKDIGSNSALAKMLEMFKSMTEDDLPKLKFSRTRFIFKIPILIAGILSCTPPKGQSILAEVKARNQKWEHLDVGGMPAGQIAGCCAEIVNAFRELLEGWKGGRIGNAPYLFGTMIAYPGLQWVCAKWLSDVTYVGRLLAGVGNMDDAQAAIDLWQLAIKANEIPELKQHILTGGSWQKIAAAISDLPQTKPFLEIWNDFMARHGHHCRAEIELGNPRWFESPDYILGIIRSYICCINKTNPLENREEINRQRRSLEQYCRRQFSNPIKRLIFDHLLVRSQNCALFRENIKSEAVKLLAAMRKLLIELGHRLHASGVLAEPDDIFFLRVEEIEPVTHGRAEFDIKNVIAERRAEYNKWTSVTPPDLIVGRFDPSEYVPEEVAADVDVLRGLAVSPGVATGKAKVILRTDGDSPLEAGEILVAPFTDPGWTPYFLPAAAIVMNQGSLLSHGAIVARELGIPAVTNVGHATKIIKTGQTIQVDGNNGIVKIIQLADAKY
jgi:phosphohistidine swiveling domain-containing protein